jgi:hypothetical protein
LGLFKQDFNRPGRGVDKEEPRKKGFRRFIEVLSRDFWDLVKLNLFFCALLFPSAALFLFGLFLSKGLAFILIPIAAIPVGGASAACMFCVTKMLRDDPGYIWYDFKRKFLENVKHTMIPGILYAIFIYAQIYLWGVLVFGGRLYIGIGWILLGFASLLTVWMVMTYFFILAAYLDLKTIHIIKNSVLISFANFKSSFIGALAGGVIWIVFFLLLPHSMLFAPLIPLIGFSLSWLLKLMWIWPPVNKQFSIEEILRERHKR